MTTELTGRELNEQLAQLFEPKPSPPPDEAFDLFMSGSPMKSPLGFWIAVCELEKGDIPEWQPIALSSDMNAAMRVVEKIASRNGDTIVSLTRNSRDGQRMGSEPWYCTIEDVSDGIQEWEATAETAAEAICRAAMEALKDE